MSIQINKSAYEKLIKEDIEWLLSNTKDSLERRHIVEVLNYSPERLYASGSSEIPNDLEEAADEYFKNPENSWVVKDIFIAGAKWQKEQDLSEMAQSKSPLSVAYANRCFENGKQAMKEQMMKEAIHYVVQDDLDSHGASYNIPFIRIGTTALKPKGIGVGDKVRIIIVKED